MTAKESRRFKVDTSVTKIVDINKIKQILKHEYEVISCNGNKLVVRWIADPSITHTFINFQRLKQLSETYDCEIEAEVI